MQTFKLTRRSAPSCALFSRSCGRLQTLAATVRSFGPKQGTFGPGVVWLKSASQKYMIVLQDWKLHICLQQKLHKITHEDIFELSVRVNDFIQCCLGLHLETKRSGSIICCVFFNQLKHIFPPWSFGKSPGIHGWLTG